MTKREGDAGAIPSALPSGIQALECGVVDVDFENNENSDGTRIVFMQVIIDETPCIVKKIKKNN